MKRPRRPAHALRAAVECLPTETKRAMLSGIEANSIIVGAYTDRYGGICPMLAAHRNGGRTSFAAFARAWDRYTHAKGKPRDATEREIRTLTAMLEASLASDPGESTDLARAITEHEQLVDARPKRRRRPLRTWLPVHRRLDTYEAAGHPVRGIDENTGDPVRERTPAGR